MHGHLQAVYNKVPIPLKGLQVLVDDLGETPQGHVSAPPQREKNKSKHPSTCHLHGKNPSSEEAGHPGKWEFQVI